MEPIGLECTLTWSRDIFEYGNHTYPHMIDYERYSKCSFTISDQVGAAGMMWSCIDDMEKYLSFLLNNSEVDGKRILSEKTFNYIFEPQIIIGSSFILHLNSLNRIGEHMALVGFNTTIEDLR